jgi:hypothetical protein
MKQQRRDVARAAGASVARKSAADPSKVSKTAELWTRRNAASGEFTSLRRKGVSFRGSRGA